MIQRYLSFRFSFHEDVYWDIRHAVFNNDNFALDARAHISANKSSKREIVTKEEALCTETHCKS